MTALIIIGVIVFILLFTVNVPVTAYVKYYGGKADIRVKYAFVSLYPRKEKKPEKKRVGKKENSASEDEDIKQLEDMYDFSEEETKPEGEPEKEPENEASQKIKAEEETQQPKTEPEKKKTGKKAAKKDKADKKEKKSLSGKLEELESKKDSVLLLAELVKGPLKRFCKKIRIDGIVIDFAAAAEDAADAAVAYGRLGAAVYDGIAFLKQFIKMTVRSVTIDCLYNTPEEKSRYDGECKVRLRPASLLNALFAVLFGYLFHMKKYAPVMELIKK